ncbi:hypothetical protein Bca101_098668 [Brassica carinata]|uniref:Uncharacterized protein n=2 Tax=Brassica oleracea var. oleracea TaxID=109376 RepID=A0A0D3CVW5_BRAOL
MGIFKVIYHHLSLVKNPNSFRDSADASSSTAAGGHVGSGEAMGRGLSTMLESIIKEFDSKANDAFNSQDQLSGSLDRLVQGKRTIVVHSTTRVEDLERQTDGVEATINSSTNGYGTTLGTYQLNQGTLENLRLGPDSWLMKLIKLIQGIKNTILPKSKLFY